MEGSGTLGNSRGCSSTTASDSSTVEIKALLYFQCKPAFSVSDGKLQIAGDRLPHLIHLRNDISYEHFEENVRNKLSLHSMSYYSLSYYLPGQGLIALSSEEDMKYMIEEFNESIRIQGPQIFKVFVR